MNLLHLYKPDLATITLCGQSVVQPWTYDLEQTYIACADCTAVQACDDARVALVEVGLDAALPEPPAVGTVDLAIITSGA